MPTKKPEPSLTALAAPKPRTSGKGEPPKTAADTSATGQNTKSPSDGKLVDLGFKVSTEYRRNYRLFCADRDMTQVDAFKEAMADYMKKKGWTTTGD